VSDIWEVITAHGEREAGALVPSLRAIAEMPCNCKARSEQQEETSTQYSAAAFVKDKETTHVWQRG